MGPCPLLGSDGFVDSLFSRHSALLLRKQTTEKGCHDLGNPTSSNSKIQQNNPVPRF